MSYPALCLSKSDACKNLPPAQDCQKQQKRHPDFQRSSSAKPASVARRNARERNRVKQVNNGFMVLKQHLPSGARHRKMSKVETLRKAVDYIRTLQDLLGCCQKDPSLECEIDTESDGSSVLSERSACDDAYSSLPDYHHHHHHQAPYWLEPPPASDRSPYPAYCCLSNPEVCHSYGECPRRAAAYFPEYGQDSKNSSAYGSADEELLDAIMCWQRS